MSNTQCKCLGCSETKRHRAFGLCVNCYDQCRRAERGIKPRIKKPAHKCTECGEIKPYKSLGMCDSCYRYSRRPEVPKRVAKPRPFRHCDKCNQFRPSIALGLCSRCYQSSKKKGQCKECEQVILLHAHGLCAACYSRQTVVTCSSCEQVKIRAAEGLCHACYKRKHLPIIIRSQILPLNQCIKCEKWAHQYLKKGLCDNCEHKTRRQAKRVCDKCNVALPRYHRGKVCKSCK